MARTRSVKSAPAKSKDATKSKDSASNDDDTSDLTSKFKLLSTTGESSKIFILPSAASPEAKVVTLPHPRHAHPSRYLACPQGGLYEFTKMAAPKTTPRSWLIAAARGSETENQVTMGSDLFVATPIDPLFLALPALAHVKASKDPDRQKRLFLTFDDHLDNLPQANSHMSHILRWQPTRAAFEARMRAVCDTLDAGDECMFRLDEKKLLDVVLQKAQRMSRDGLPPSMEDKFVRKALEAPLVLKRTETTRTDSAPQTPTLTQTDSATSQSASSAADTGASSTSQTSTAATSLADEPVDEVLVNAMEASTEVIQLQRLRVAFDFICVSYLSPALAMQLKQSLIKGGADSMVDFTPLNDYLASLEKLRSESMATTSTADFSRRRRRDEEEDETRQEKKRKLEEEKKKKASESKAVRDLKKVNTTGMKKLSEFFKKK